jgi:hypothetical protein
LELDRTKCLGDQDAAGVLKQKGPVIHAGDLTRKERSARPALERLVERA